MKQLTIWLLGRSELLQALNEELNGFGHQCLIQVAPVNTLPSRPLDLVIDDGSLPFDEAHRRDLGQAAQISLKVCIGSNDACGLPDVALAASLGGQIVAYSQASIEHGGNGRVLHEQALAHWVAELAEVVGEYARDEAAFALQGISHASSRASMDLRAFDAIAYRHQGNATSAAELLTAAEQPLAQRLDNAVIRYSSLTALRCNGQAWTYAQLRAAAEPVRHYVSSLDTLAQPPTVGVCMAKSPELFACVLGIVLAGGVYLPLEPAHPVERRRYILENSGAQVLLQPDDEPALQGSWQRQDPRRLPEVPHLAATPPSNANAPCMALYTSGTTGQPKGVLLSQRNLSHFTAWYASYVQLDEASRVLQFSTLSFDSATIDIFPTWLSGATLIVASDDERRDSALLTAMITREAVTHGFIPPAMLSILPLDELTQVQCIATGGDVCEPWVIDSLAERCRFLNLYGPTEATVLVTASRFLPGCSNRLLGWPIANSQVWLLGEDGKPVRNNEVGELHIIGPGVGLGYINNPTQTVERYVQIRLPDGDCVRAYRTGDLGRWGPDGLELVGRKDNQVKIRGFRVEPEEIEYCLREARLYEQVAVIIDERRRILAFVARPLSTDRSGDAAIRDYVAAHLPTYMHPTHYIELSTLPAAANGKVDRQALGALPVPSSVAEATVPLTECQTLLQNLWADLLELAPEEISTSESFFNLGGHSILLSKMLLGLRERFDRSVSINRFIELPTIERLEQLLQSEQGNTSGLVAPQALQDAERTIGVNPLPLFQIGDVHKVIVTGANSFVGVHIVAALLDWGASEVACLVRAPSAESAEHRFAEALVDNRLRVDQSRVKVFAADLTQPLFGLSAAEHSYLDDHYGSLIHNAANVNHVLDYVSLVPDNVEPLFELLKFCESRRKKILNFVSTLSACSAVDNNGDVLETGATETPPIYIRNGYNLSKWVGERLLGRASAMGCFVNIFRPGNISFNSSTGVCQPHKNRLMLMLKGSLQLAAVPALDMNFDLMPVDFLAKLIAFQSSRYEPGAAVFNLHNPQPLSWTDYVASFTALGHNFDLVPIATWQAKLQEVDKDNALFGVLGFYLNGFEEDIGDISRIHHSSTAAAVARMGEQYPVKSAKLLASGTTYLRSIGFI